MSADLFAEFSNLDNPNNPPASSQHVTNSKAAQKSSSTPQPMPAWQPSLLSSSSSVSGWAQSFPQSQPAANAPRLPDGHDDNDGDDDDDDGWGDFETADQATASVTPPAADARGYAPTTTTLGWNPHSTASDLQPSRQNVTQSWTKEVVTNDLLGLDAAGDQSAQKSQSASSSRETKRIIQVKATPSDPNVLFDADDFELHDEGDNGDNGDELDDFGEFEAVEPRLHFGDVAFTASSAFDLLGLDDPPIEPGRDSITDGFPRASASPLSFGAMSSMTMSQHMAPVPSHQSQLPPSPAFDKQPATVEPVLTPKASIHETNPHKDPAYPASTGISIDATSGDDDDWAAWDDFPGGDGGGSSVIPASGKKAAPNDAGQRWEWDEGEESCFTSVSADNNSPPPTNVPPPAILLSVFPDLFSSGDVLFKPLSGQTATIRKQLLSNPRTVSFLQGYILIATTAARIIAGRKHRWHRDKILAKSMSVSAAGSKGMKLAGLDKTRAARDDREAADVVAAWKEYVGRLRSAVAAANAAADVDLKVPELTESAQIQTAKMVPTAARPCIVCGLKREERVARVDFDVEDSFGEWWVDHWGHRACKNFWLRHEEKLRQR
ncbi:hypothetical protein E4U41_000831 [Claviceps citrina]|nr:hypothetical protein E4U41_000831 [Claviceps citrina]